MSSSFASATSIDLSRLPAPNVIEQLDYPSIVNAARAQMLALWPPFSATVESDPLQKLIELFAYRELLLRAEFNDRARGCMVAFAMGADLDQLAALLGSYRLELEPADPVAGTPAIMESDAEFRRRVILAPEAYSVAGPEGAYVWHALSTSGDVLDASATSPDPGDVLVTVLSRDADGTASPALLALVEARVSADDVRPLTDHVMVQSAEIVPFVVTASIETFAGPDSAIVLNEARAKLDAYLETSHRLGRDVVRSGIYASLHVEGVSRVTLSEPAADIILDRTQAGYCTAVTLTHAGTGE